MQVFEFADQYRGSYSDSLSSVVCPFYCSYSGYNVRTAIKHLQHFLSKTLTSIELSWNHIIPDVTLQKQDELLWGASWLHRASQNASYMTYIQSNGHTLGADDDDFSFSWDDKRVGTKVLLSKVFILHLSSSFSNAREANNSSSMAHFHRASCRTGLKNCSHIKSILIITSALLSLEHLVSKPSTHQVCPVFD